MNFNKVNHFLLFLVLLVVCLHFGAPFLIPVAIASILALLLLPVTQKLRKWKFGKVGSILVSELLLILLIAGFTILFYTQVASFVNDIPNLKAKSSEKLDQFYHFIQSQTDISPGKQLQWIKNEYDRLLDSSGKIIKDTLVTATSLIISLGLIIFYIFLFLYYRASFNEFLLSYIKKEKHHNVYKILRGIEMLVHHYLTGLLMVMGILGTMHSIGLLVLGIPHAIFLGYLASFLIIIPYAGTFIGSLIPILIAFLTKDSFWYAFGVMGVFGFNLFIESHVLIPGIIGNHVKISALIVIMGIIAGELIWGIPGMILFIPLLGMLKVICDNIEILHPLGKLLEGGKDNS